MPKDKAPDGMPTQIIRNMLQFAEQGVTDWTSTAADYRKRLGVAERAAERYTADVERYSEQLRHRIEQEEERG